MSKKKVVVDELHKPARKNFERRKVIIRGFDDLWQIDLVEMGAYAAENKGYRYMLTVIDCFSKFAWAKELKTKTGVEVTKAMESIFNYGRQPKNIQSDDGKEFFNKNFQDLMKKFKINHYSTFSVMKASIVERFNRTLKQHMWKSFSFQGSYKWLSILPKIILKYNDTVHRTIKMKPNCVRKSHEEELMRNVYNGGIDYTKLRNKRKFKVGDTVRISKYKHIFEKGYTPNWTTELFKIKKVQSTYPLTYLIEDYQNQSIKGGFYGYELQKVKYDDVYLIEKILKKKGSKVFVKWLGFDNTHNTWINKNKLK